MHSTVTFKMARALQEEGIACLRINFRGVGRSEGRFHGEGAEEDDARAAIEWLLERFPAAAVWAAGFSFGSRTVLGLAGRDARIERLVLAGFPARVYPLSGAGELELPALFLWGSEDEYGTSLDVREKLVRLPPGFEFQEIAGADHFFRRATGELESRIRDWARDARKDP